MLLPSGPGFGRGQTCLRRRVVRPDRLGRRLAACEALGGLRVPALPGSGVLGAFLRVDFPAIRLLGPMCGVDAEEGASTTT